MKKSKMPAADVARDIRALFASGWTKRSIAARLGVSEAAVSTALASVGDVRAMLVSAALRMGGFSTDDTIAVAQAKFIADQILSANVASVEQAQGLEGAMAWLDGHDSMVTVESTLGGARWALPDGRGAVEHSWSLAIFAAARSLGWPGGGR